MFRAPLDELKRLLPFLSKVADSSGGESVETVVLRPGDEHFVCIVRLDQQCPSPFCLAVPVVTIAFTHSAGVIGEHAELSSNGEHAALSGWSSQQLAGLLSAAGDATHLSIANRILSSFQFDERAELEYEPWIRNFAASLATVIKPDAIQLRLRTPADFWESRGDRWIWPSLPTIQVTDLDARRMSDLCRSGGVECETLPRGHEAAAMWTAYLPLRSRALNIGVLALHYARVITPLPDEMRLLELVQREVALLMDRTRTHLRMQRLATIDGLTNLFNHRFFRIQLRTEFQRALRYQKKMSLVMIDIDDFKNYNDRYGHLAGDRVLIEVAKTIRATVRDIDSVSRYGGEEFALILPEVDSTGGMVVAEKVRLAIGAQRFRTESGEDMGSITVSCGVTDNVNTTSPNDLIRRADRALYWVKTHGRNLVRLADPMEES